MHFSLSVILTIAWTLLPSSFDYFNISVPNVDYSMKVVIDAGHGGRDGGCIGAPHNEKDIVLPIALELGRLIETQLPDVEVIYTREEDEFVALNKRAKIANDAKADLFISIHANSLPALKSLKGSETYVMGLGEARANLAVAKRENAAIILEEDYKDNYQGYDPNSDEGHILLSMFQNIHLEKSIYFASLVEESIEKYAHGHSRGVKQAGFLVLRATNMPSVLIESGYLTNSSDNEYLQEESGQMEIAYAIFEAFKIYKVNQGTPLIAQNEIIKESIPQVKLVKQAKDSKLNEKDIGPKSESIKKETTFAPAPKLDNAQTLVYRVQLAASTKPIKEFKGKWKKISASIQVKKEGKYYKYLSPSRSTIAEGKELLKTLQDGGFDAAFLVEYKGDKRVKIVR